MSAPLDSAVTNMQGDAALPRDNGELSFAAPWEGRALAMALAVVDKLGLEWDEFRHELIGAIEADADRSYYESWTAALEALAVAHGLTDPDDLSRRAAAVVPPA